SKHQPKHINLDLSYDLQKPWPIVHPFLITPGQEDSYKHLQIAGQFNRTFHLSGNYPAGVAFNDAVKNLSGDGALAVAMLDTQGARIENLEVPITLDHGKLFTLYAGKPKAERAAKPASFNTGTL